MSCIFIVILHIVLVKSVKLFIYSLLSVFSSCVFLYCFVLFCFWKRSSFKFPNAVSGRKLGTLLFLTTLSNAESQRGVRNLSVAHSPDVNPPPPQAKEV